MSTAPIRQAVILAAGRGSRMGGLTDRDPKCLTPLAGRPILEWTLQSLQANGIKDVLIIGGWQAEQLIPWATHLRHNPRWDCSNMVRSLQLADDWLKRAPTLVVYGDGAYGTKALHSALEHRPGDLVLPVDTHWLSLWQRRFENPLEDAEVLHHQNGLLTRIGQQATSLEEIQGQYMGLLRISPSGWLDASAVLTELQLRQGTESVDRLDMTGLLQALLDAGHAIACTEVAGGWVEIDSVQDLQTVESALTEPGFSHDFRY